MQTCWRLAWTSVTRCLLGRNGLATNRKRHWGTPRRDINGFPDTCVQNKIMKRFNSFCILYLFGSWGGRGWVWNTNLKATGQKKGLWGRTSPMSHQMYPMHYNRTTTSNLHDSSPTGLWDSFSSVMRLSVQQEGWLTILGAAEALMQVPDPRIPSVWKP